jgi:hypothetical protein
MMRLVRPRARAPGQECTNGASAQRRAERAPVGDAHMVEVPEGADAALAAGLGIAGLARSPLPCSAPAACGR